MYLVNKTCLLTILSLTLISVGVVLAVFWMDIFHILLTKNMALAPDAETVAIWKKPPFDIQFDIYLYNWTNPNHLTTVDFEKPILKEIGPYRFREVHEKTNLIWHHENNTVSYKRKSTYHFVEEESFGRLNDKIVTINAFAVSVAYTARNWNWLLQRALSLALDRYKHKAFVIKEARELLFEGYEDDLITLANRMSHILPFKLEIPYDRFGWMYGRNESEEIMGHYNINTGQDDISKLGVTRVWNYQTSTPYYSSPCNDVHGSGGEFFPPGQTKDRPISVFNGELCRYLDLYFSEECEINGINLLKFSGNERSVDNGTKYSENACFSSGESLPNGLMNISSCRYGAPAFVSFPHFYAADPYYLRSVDGLKPSKNEHEMYVAMEPTSAIPIEVVGRMQINLMITPLPNIGIFKEAPTLFFPAFWLEQKVRIPDDKIQTLKISTMIPTIGFICIGVIIAIGGILLVFTYCCQKHRGLKFSKTLYKKWLSKKVHQNTNSHDNINTNTNTNTNMNPDEPFSRNGVEADITR